MMKRQESRVKGYLRDASKTNIAFANTLKNIQQLNTLNLHLSSPLKRKRVNREEAHIIKLTLKAYKARNQSTTTNKQKNNQSRIMMRTRKKKNTKN